MHFCADELFAILAAFPFLSGVFFWMRSRIRVWLKETNAPCCESHPLSLPNFRERDEGGIREPSASRKSFDRKRRTFERRFDSGSSV